MMPYGVFVVTARDERGPHGMTASWVMQVALAPPLIAAAVAHGRTTGEVIAKSGAFAVNLLARGAAEIAERFFTPYQRLGHAAPFADYDSATTGAPLLKDAIAVLECRVRESLEVGDHTLFVGEVVGAHLRSEQSPLTAAEAGFHYGR
jgi:flavin reductase (DIM6/NTAB) family NADH-FMN oxidoreductase RutF